MNKIIKHSLLSVACLASALAFTSCDTDVESLDINQPGIAQGFAPLVTKNHIDRAI